MTETAQLVSEFESLSCKCLIVLKYIKRLLSSEKRFDNVHGSNRRALIVPVVPHS